MKFTEIIGRRVSDLTFEEVKTLMQAATASGANALRFTANRGFITDVSHSSFKLPDGKRCIEAGNVAWIQTGGAHVAMAWVILQAWSGTLSAAPITAAESVAFAQRLSFVGKHVTDLKKRDVELALEYTAARGGAALEIDICQNGFVTGAYILNRVDSIFSATGTRCGAVVGVACASADVLSLLQLQIYIDRLHPRF